ncbi:13262_t:CDS:2, partial [Cetraspora pellucida]
VMIEHSVRGKITSIAIRNGLLEGQLLSHNGSVVRTMTNATRMTVDRSADGDIFTVRELLLAAGADLDSPSTAPGANKTAHEIYRTSGIVIVIGKQIAYQYIPQVIDGNEYKTVERIYNGTDGSVTLKIAEYLVEFLMLWVLPEKEYYGIAKFQETNSFDEWRKNKRLQENQLSSDPNAINVSRIDFYDNVHISNNSNTGKNSGYYNNNVNTVGHYINMNDTGGHYNHYSG